MKCLGLIGGMSWTSTISYYRRFNQLVGERLGGHHSARLLLYSVDFEAVERLQHAGRWDEAGDLLADAARRLVAGGAEGIVLCTNTMHKVAGHIEAAVDIPLLHIADATGERIRADGHRRVGLLGTRFTMEQPFYRERLAERYGLEVLAPGDNDREMIHRVIFDELCAERIEPASRRAYQRIIAGLAENGAEAVILGCTEITLLIGPADVSVPVFDTTELHVRAAVDFALGKKKSSGMSWYRLDLGDALLAEGELDDIRGRCRAAFERAGAPAGWAVYQAHVSGDLHCRAHLFFSPAAAALARDLGARRCDELPQEMSLLAGDGAGCSNASTMAD